MCVCIYGSHSNMGRGSDLCAANVFAVNVAVAVAFSSLNSRRFSCNVDANVNDAAADANVQQQQHY